MEESIYSTGIRPHIDEYFVKKSQERRDYGEYWSASSAGYCMRKVIFDRLGVAQTSVDARKQRVFESGHIFHSWIQGVTKDAGISISQEGELIDNELMVKGHYDDIVLVNDHLILYDYKTAHSRSFTYKKGRPMSYFHMMQLGTYMYMVRKEHWQELLDRTSDQIPFPVDTELSEARICSISKDDLRMDETQLLWSNGLEQEVVQYWNTINQYWKAKKIPSCTCGERERNEKTGIGFMADARYNPYFFQGEPCSLAWYQLWKSGDYTKYIKEI